ncbi:MAG: diadenylate cyclase CdaA [bacterium]
MLTYLPILGLALPGARGVLEILVMGIVFYYVMLFFHGTRGAQVLSGLLFLIIALLVLTYVFRLDTLTWILQRFSVYVAVALLIIFQPEIRRALAELGNQHVFVSSLERSVVDNIVKAATMLAERKIGALIAIERETGTKAVQETGTMIDSLVTPELLASIFYPHTPLHDGGVVISKNRVVAAGCLFPLSQREELSKSLGTRHRAAIGLTEDSDAVVIVVSEETGSLSLAFKGRLRRGLDEQRLKRILASVMYRGSVVKPGDSSGARRRIEWVRDFLTRSRAATNTEGRDDAL